MWAPRTMDLGRIREVAGLEGTRNQAYTAPAATVNPLLTHLSSVMEPAIEQVSEKVFNAVGFDVANSTFVIGKDGVIVIDAMTSVDNLLAALLAFREICEYPVAGLVYTHSHGDHWAGSPALLDPSNPDDIPVIAQRAFMAEVGRINGFNQPIMGARAAYQFGTYLDCSAEGRVNVGAGPELPMHGRTGLVPPNVLVDQSLELEIAGLTLEVTWVPSEAPDGIAVWMPTLGVLQCAECVQGECYPNLYTLRGDVPRPAMQWVESLDVLRTFPAEALAKSHGRSVVGREASAEHLRNYRDVIQWTHDQTVRYMNKGYVPDQIVEAIGAMPPHLLAYETTGTQGYGSVPHGSRSIYNWYLGFNTGQTIDFDPAPYAERQRRYVEAMGGAERVMDLARESMDAGDNRWAIEILGYLVRHDPDDARARQLSAEAHRAEGFRKANATWRDWYLTAALELEGRIPIAGGVSSRDVQLGLPLTSLAASLPVRLRAELAWYVELTLDLVIEGAEQASFTAEVRRGVLEIRPLDGSHPSPTSVRFVDKLAFVDYLTGMTVASLVADQRAEVVGDDDPAQQFAALIDAPPSMNAILVTLRGPVDGDPLHAS